MTTETRGPALPSGQVGFTRMDSLTYGVPAATAVAAEATRLGAERVFVIASHTLNTTTNEIDKVRTALGGRYCGTFDAMSAHTPRGDVIAATSAARDAGADLLVTFGGGSVTDAAKAVRLCLANGIDTTEAIDLLAPVVGPDGALGPRPECAAPRLRQIAVPTTLSGGEFSAIAGVTDERTGTKHLLRHPCIVPHHVVLDPAVTVHTPEWLWLSTGVRAVDHCVEGICALEANAFGDAQATEGLSRLVKGLTDVRGNPTDLQARLTSQLGTWLSMGPLTTGVPMGASHGIGYVLGAAFGVPHGHTSCIMLPAVMRWNRRANADRQAIVAAAMGDASGEADELLGSFIGGLGMPRSLAAVGIGRDQFASIAEQAMSTPWVPRNPRPIDGPDQIVEILEFAAE